MCVRLKNGEIFFYFNLLSHSLLCISATLTHYYVTAVIMREDKMCPLLYAPSARSRITTGKKCAAQEMKLCEEENFPCAKIKYTPYIQNTLAGAHTHTYWEIRQSDYGFSVKNVFAAPSIENALRHLYRISTSGPVCCFIFISVPNIDMLGERERERSKHKVRIVNVQKRR